MFSIMPSVYCSGPSHPGGVKSGQRPGPDFFEKSMRIALERMSSSGTAAGIGGLGRSRGEVRIVALVSGTMSLGDAGPGFGLGSGVGWGIGAGGGVANARLFENGPSVVGSYARTCQ